MEPLEQGFVRVIAHYGFMENPRLSDILERCREKGVVELSAQVEL